MPPSVIGTLAQITTAVSALLQPVEVPLDLLDAVGITWKQFPAIEDSGDILQS